MHWANNRDYTVDVEVPPPATLVPRGSICVDARKRADENPLLVVSNEVERHDHVYKIAKTK